MCKCGVSLINYHLLRHFLQNEDVFQCPSIYQSLFAISMRREIKHDKFVAQKCSLVEQENSKMKYSLDKLFIYFLFTGTGTFGRVALCLETNEKSFYALKILSINDIVHKKQIEHVKNEKNILLEISHPFIVQMYVSTNSIFIYFLKFTIYIFFILFLTTLKCVNSFSHFSLNNYYEFYGGHLR